MCGESRMHGVGRGKRWRLLQSLTYRYSFFTDPTISAMTSGRPSQNTDLASLSFPRRLGVRFLPAYLTKYKMVGMQARWDAFEDKDFTKMLDRKKFHHNDQITREGWAKYYFDGIFPKSTAYLRLQIFDTTSDLLVKSFYFQFVKGYKTSLDGRFYLKDPVLETKIVKGGVMYELIPKTVTGADGEKKVVYERGSTTVKEHKIRDIIGQKEKVTLDVPVIRQTQVRYIEKPKALFLVTPPHLMAYAKLILILVKQLVDVSFEQSYMTKASQKPLYKTRYMLDNVLTN